MDSATAKSTIRKPFIDHIHELQLRLTWSVLAIVAGSIVGYMLHDQLLNLIQKPLGETLYYTSPTGGFSFVFKLSVVFGIVAALPVIVFNLFGFTKPLFNKPRRWMMFRYITWSVLLAGAGIVFAYMVSLPAALRFLTNFGGQQIESLITADAYFNFALAYIAGFAVLFQLPLIILFINRITPLKPGKMMSAQKYIILGSFIIAAILTPTPDPINQSIMAVPVVLLYQISIILVLLTNIKRKPKHKKVETVVVKPNLASQPRKVAQPIRSLVQVVPVTETYQIPKPQPRLIDMVIT